MAANILWQIGYELDETFGTMQKINFCVREELELGVRLHGAFSSLCITALA